MISIVTVKQANLNLAPLLEQIKNGDTVILTSHGKPVAIMLQVDVIAGEMSNKKIKELMEVKCEESASG